MSGGPVLFLLNMAGAAALLIWAVRLVRTGFERAFGASLRLWLRRSTGNRISAAGCGALSAILMQSSTAVAVLMAGFVAAGTIAGRAGLAVMLGADLGSAVVAQILNARIGALTPLLLLAGVLIFLRSQRRRPRQIGRILIGLALIFLSLEMIRAASQPLMDNAGARSVMLYLAGDPISAFLIAAALAWLVHSSVAAVLLFATLAGQGALPLEAALAMVLGANLGGSMIAVMLTLRSESAVRRVVWANLALRGGGAAVALWLVEMPGVAAAVLPWADAGQQALALHLIFNGGLLVIFLPLIGPVLKLAAALIPEPPAGAGTQALPSALDPAALSHPRRAFSCAVRELVLMGGRVEDMLRRVMPLFERYDEDVAGAIRDELARLARMSLELRIYLAGIRAEGNEKAVGTRAFDLAGIAMSLEAGADVIARKMVKLAERKALENLSFSEDGWRDLLDFHDTVLRNAQLGISVLMTENPELARALFEQKEKVRDLAQELERKHLERLRQGLSETIETSSMHLDLLRALKAINTSFAAIAYPLLHESGDLLSSRLAGS